LNPGHQVAGAYFIAPIPDPAVIDTFQERLAMTEGKDKNTESG